jgi:large subunit ribosomal protein L3
MIPFKILERGNHCLFRTIYFCSELGNFMKAILGRKIGMTQVTNEKNIVEPVTIIEAGPCFVSQIRTDEKDGYIAVQIAFGDKKNLNITQKGHLKSAKIENNFRFLREFKIEDPTKFELGQEIKADIFTENDKVDAIGISKGKGFQGVIKRHGFSRGPETHGSHHHRHPGSIGSMFPQHVIKGKKMPGHMGNVQITTKNLKIIKIDVKKNIMAIKGAIPGPNKSFVIIRGK